MQIFGLRKKRREAEQQEAQSAERDFANLALKAGGQKLSAAEANRLLDLAASLLIPDDELQQIEKDAIAHHQAKQIADQQDSRERKLNDAVSAIENFDRETERLILARRNEREKLSGVKSAAALSANESRAAARQLTAIEGRSWRLFGGDSPEVIAERQRIIEANRQTHAHFAQQIFEDVPVGLYRIITVEEAIMGCDRHSENLVAEPLPGQSIEDAQHVKELIVSIERAQPSRNAVYLIRQKDVDRIQAKYRREGWVVVYEQLLERGGTEQNAVLFIPLPEQTQRELSVMEAALHEAYEKSAFGSEMMPPSGALALR